MGTIRLIAFECRKQSSSLTFLLILAIVSIFAVSQFTEVFHIPVKSEQDIQALAQSGDRDYILVDNSEVELVSKSVIFLQSRLKNHSIPRNMETELNDLITLLEDDTHSFDDVMLLTQENEALYPWLLACKAQFGQRVGSVEEANQLVQSSLGNTGYSPILYKNYVTYMQIITALIMFPLFIFVCIRDYRHGMYEIVYAQPLKPNKYIISRYFGAFIPLTLYLYLLGLLLNLISTSRFINAGYAYQYTAFFPAFALYLLPCMFFFSALLMLLMLLVKKVVAVFPLYVIFVLLNVTPGVFGASSDFVRTISPIIRLDEPIASMRAIMANRIAYFLLGVVFLWMVCNLYKGLRKDLRKGITV